MQKAWKSVKISQSYREYKCGNFFETQCRLDIKWTTTKLQVCPPSKVSLWCIRSVDLTVGHWLTKLLCNGSTHSLTPQRPSQKANKMGYGADKKENWGSFRLVAEEALYLKSATVGYDVEVVCIGSCNSRRSKSDIKWYHEKDPTYRTCMKALGRNIRHLYPFVDEDPTSQIIMSSHLNGVDMWSMTSSSSRRIDAFGYHWNFLPMSVMISGGRTFGTEAHLTCASVI